MFRELIRQNDRVLLDDLTFNLEPEKTANLDIEDKYFNLHKDRYILEGFFNFFSRRPEFNPQNILELGIWGAGSVVYWFEQFKPRKHIAIDIQERSDSEFFRNYIASRKLEDRIHTYWSTDQADSIKLREIVKKEFNSSLDLVIDDASHSYDPTKTSFETLFPFLRPGGLYIIEDWSWVYWKEVLGPDHPLVSQKGLDELISELTRACVKVGRTLIPSITITQSFAVVERGDMELSDFDGFRINDYIIK